MELTRRFVFRANASAHGGQILRRDDARLSKPDILITGATSSLTVVGGRSIGQSRPAKFVDGFVRVGEAQTEAIATFDDFKRAVLMSRGDVPEDSLTTTTTVGASVEDVVFGKGPKALLGEQPPDGRGHPRLSIGWVGGQLISFSGKPGDEPSVKIVPKKTSIDEVVIDGFPLKVTLNKSLFEQLDTFSKVQTASADATFMQDTKDCLFREARPTARADGSTGAVRPETVILGTMVGELAWGRRGKHPTATLTRHGVIVPDFGTVYFGEILMSPESRRVTMVRVKFGSPVGGYYACSEYDQNGGWYPPAP